MLTKHLFFYWIVANLIIYEFVHDVSQSNVYLFCTKGIYYCIVVYQNNKITVHCLFIIPNFYNSEMKKKRNLICLNRITLEMWLDFSVGLDWEMLRDTNIMICIVICDEYYLNFGQDSRVTNYTVKDKKFKSYITFVMLQTHKKDQYLWAAVLT